MTTDIAPQKAETSDDDVTAHGAIGELAMHEMHDSAQSDTAERVAKAIEELRPVLQRDGGDIELVRIDGDIVVVDLKGTCVGCVLASVTVTGIRKRMVELVGRPLKVIPKSAFVPLRRMKAAR